MRPLTHEQRARLAPCLCPVLPAVVVAWTVDVMYG